MAAEASSHRPSVLWSRELLLLVWLPTVIIGVLHYATPSSLHWGHDVLRRLYYIPIIVAALLSGVRGGMAVSVVASLSYAPHAFFMEGHHDPGGTTNKVLEIILYNVIAVTAGLLADREGRRRRQVEEAYAEQQRMADQLVRAGRLAALGELVAGVAHEIRNPLHSLKGTAEIVDEVVPVDVEQRKMWDIHREEILRLERIAERFLSFARPSTPSLQRMSLPLVYERLSELALAQVKGAGVELRVDALPESMRRVELETDRDQVAQIVLNIVQNAARAMPADGLIRLSVRSRTIGARDYVCLRIENDGPSIPKDQLEKIFDPFVTGSEEGTGLGLAISQRIAEEHGGFIEVENIGPERGVAFMVLLPSL